MDNILILMLSGLFGLFGFCLLSLYWLNAKVERIRQALWGEGANGSIVSEIGRLREAKHETNNELGDMKMKLEMLWEARPKGD